MSSEVPQGAMSSTSMRMASSFAFASLLMYTGHVLRNHLRVVRGIMLPASLIAGLLGLIFIQCSKMSPALDAVVEHDLIIGWAQAPGFLISIIFATLFMGERLPGLGELWRAGGPQLAFGQVVAWGNWMIGCIVTVVILTPVWDVPPIFATLYEVGFEGGHGTAAGLRDSYITLGFPEGADLAITSATIGILLGVIVGTILCNLGTYLGWTYKSYEYEKAAQRADDLESDFESLEDGTTDKSVPKPSDYTSSGLDVQKKTPRRSVDEANGVAIGGTGACCLADFGKNIPKSIIPKKDRPVAAYMTSTNDAIDTFTLHLTVVGLAVLMAYLTIRLLIWIETFSEWLTEYAFLSGFPLFPFAMLWGLVIQVIADKFGNPNPLDRGTMERIGGLSLDFLVLTAIATTKVDAVADHIAPLLVLLMFGFSWVCFTFFVLAPLMFPDFWFERAIAEFGMATGTTATGLMLLRIIDPDMKTPALKAFSCKQLVTEPFMGGGLVTSLSLPLISAFGNWIFFGIGGAAVVFWLIVWFVLFRPMKKGFPLLSYKFNPLQSKIIHNE